jgi:Family of unknown function (DUF5939)
MSETKALFDTLRSSADQTVVAAIESVVRDGTDRQLCRINAVSFAAGHGLDEEKTISGFLHAARLGLFELSWNVLCPGCGGLLEPRKPSGPCTRRPMTARCAPPAVSRRSTRWSKSPLPSVPACAGSRRMTPLPSDMGIFPADFLGLGHRSAGNGI